VRGDLFAELALFHPLVAALELADAHWKAIEVQKGEDGGHGGAHTVAAHVESESNI
jgi:hypothetical protein